MYTTSGTYPLSFECLRQVVHIRGHLSVYDKWKISVAICVITTSGTYSWSFECLRQVVHIRGHLNVYDSGICLWSFEC